MVFSLRKESNPNVPKNILILKKYFVTEEEILIPLGETNNDIKDFIVG